MAAEDAAAAAPGDKRKPLKLDLGNLTEKNVGQLKKLNKATFPVVYDEGFYQDLLQKHLRFCQLGYFAEVLVGSICCRLEARADGGTSLVILTLSILKPYRHRGLASQLMKWAIDLAQGDEGKAADVREMRLHVQTSNSGALAFYNSFAFEITDTLMGYYPEDIELILFSPGLYSHRAISPGITEFAQPCVWFLMTGYFYAKALGAGKKGAAYRAQGGTELKAHDSDREDM
jgi:ribosomal protein S18 acetylase RimI-like enzyme